MDSVLGSIYKILKRRNIMTQGLGSKILYQRWKTNSVRAQFFESHRICRQIFSHGFVKYGNADF
jgi:hypothetical protein